MHQFSEDLSWNHGRHDIRFGGLARLINNNSINYAGVYPSGSTSEGGLAGVGTSLEPSDLASSFNVSFRTIAVDLLGPVASVTATYHYLLNGQVQPFGSPVTRDFVQNEYEGYVNDNWRVTNHLTVNLGVRYSLAPPVREANGYQVSPTVDLADWFKNAATSPTQDCPRRELHRLALFWRIRPAGDRPMMPPRLISRHASLLLTHPKAGAV